MKMENKHLANSRSAQTCTAQKLPESGSLEPAIMAAQ